MELGARKYYLYKIRRPLPALCLFSVMVKFVILAIETPLVFD